MKKLIVTINQNQKTVSFDIAFASRKFNGYTIVKRTLYVVPEHLDFFDTGVDQAVEDVGKIIKDEKYHRAKTIVHLNTIGVFAEELSLPRLTNRQAKRSIRDELKKMYPHYREQFVYDIKVFSIIRKSKKIRVMLFNKERYRKILRFFKEMNLRVGNVVLTPCTLHKIAEKRGYVSKKHPYVFINASNASTIALVHKRYLSSFHLFELALGSEFAENEGVDLLKQRMNPLQQLATELKKVVYNDLNTSIKTLHLNIEGIDNQSMATVLSEYLGQEVKPVLGDVESLKHLSVLGATLKPSKLDFTFPKKIKSIKKKKLLKKKVSVDET